MTNHMTPPNPDHEVARTGVSDVPHPPSFTILTPGELVKLVAELPDAADNLAELFDAGYVIAKRVEQ